MAKDNDVFLEYRSHIEARLSKNRARMAGAVMNRFMDYAIQSMLAGNTLTIPGRLRMKFVKLPISEMVKYFGHKFRSNKTSDWFWMIQVEGKIIDKYRYRYFPSKKICTTVQAFLNSDRVYTIL